MKKAFSLALVWVLALALLAGCGAPGASVASASAPASIPASSTPLPASSIPAVDPTTIRIGALKGPTAMGMVKQMADAEAGLYPGADYQFTIAGSIDEIPPALVQGTFDITAIPANLAAVLYNNPNLDVQVLAINTLGVLYIVENGDSVQAVADLAGKTLYASGKGAVPEYGLTYILDAAGLADSVTVEWLPEPAACVAAMAEDPSGIAMLPQPFVTTAQMQNETLRVALDLTAEWDKLQAGEAEPSAMITGVLVGRTAFIEEHPQAVASFLQDYKASVDYVNANTADAAQLVAQYDIVPAPVAEKALPQCNIVCIEGEEMQQKLSGYLAVLLAQNPDAVGGALPEDDFYYSR